MAKKNKAPKFDAQSELSTLITSFLTRADEAGKTLEDVVAELQGGEAGAGSDFDRDGVIAEIAALKIKGCAKKTLNKKTDEELAELYEEHVTAGSDESGSDSDSDGSGSDSDSDDSGSDSDSDGSGSDSDSDGSGSDESGSDESGSDESGSDESGSDSDSDGSGSESDSDSDSDGSGSESDSDSDGDELTVADMREYLVANKIEKKAKVKKLSDDEVEELYEEHAEEDSDEGSEEDGSWESDED
jgi:hypothetical protein